MWYDTLNKGQWGQTRGFVHWLNFDFSRASVYCACSSLLWSEILEHGYCGVSSVHCAVSVHCLTVSLSEQTKTWSNFPCGEVCSAMQHSTVQCSVQCRAASHSAVQSILRMKIQWAAQKTTSDVLKGVNMRSVYKPLSSHFTTTLKTAKTTNPNRNCWLDENCEIAPGSKDNCPLRSS